MSESLCNAKIGLGALLSPSEMKIIEYYTYMDTVLLNERKQQVQVAGEGAKGSAECAYSSLMQQSQETRQDANGLISNGAITMAFQAGGYGRGEMLNNKLGEAQTSVNNSNEALSILEKNRPMEPVLQRGGASLPGSDFHKFENETNGFKYGNTLTDADKAGLAAPESELAKRNAIAKATAAKETAQKTVDSIHQEKSTSQQWYFNLGQALGSMAQGTTTALKQSLIQVRAHYDAARAGTDFLNNTAQALASTLDGIYTTTYGHIATLLQTDDSLFQADSMRA